MTAVFALHGFVVRSLVASLSVFVLCGSAFAGELLVEAVPGVPFGVGRVVIPVGTAVDPEQLDTHFLSISDTEGRVLYPAVRYTQPLGVVRELLSIPTTGAPSQLHMHFLFKGTEPLQLTLQMPEPRTLMVAPAGTPAAYRRLMRSWWVRYKAASRKQRREGDYAPIVETYLTSMLSRRLGLANTFVPNSGGAGKSLSMLLGAENVRMSMLQDAVSGPASRLESQDRPAPAEIQWPAPEVPAVALADGQVEEIARHVPHECFYIRYAQFPNYSWLRRLLEEYGGDLSRMVMLRGTDTQLNRRIEDQLGIRENSLSRVLGPQVISDVAMIGRDTFLRQGGALGILFEAKNELLGTELLQQRMRRVRELAGEDAKMEEIRIEGVPVSFASTSDNRLRSFQVRDGKYHLVTNCYEIAKRFLQCGQGRETLGDSAEFRYARSLSPLGEDNTLFIYLSRRFFEGLLSPQYQIEIGRRFRSLTDNDLLALANLAAAAEGHGPVPLSMERLVELGFVGQRTSVRPDGSFAKWGGQVWSDSQRGARGTYLPIPDMPIGNVTQTESDRFLQTADFHRQHWKQMDPVLVGIRRSALNDDAERVEVQVRMLPVNQQKYGMYTRFFGDATPTRIRPLPDDIVSVQAFVDGGDLSINPHHLYFGIRDAAPKADYSERRILKSFQVIRTAPAYIAAWPRPGFLDSIGVYGRPLGDGYQRMLLGLFRFELPNGFSWLSFDRKIIADVAPRMETEQFARSAQMHVKVGDVKHSKFGSWANDLSFQRAWETSLGNVHLLHLVTQQLRVPMPDARKTAEQILNAELICPLGGDYRFIQDPGGTARWASSAWTAGKQPCREEYVSPLMAWLRGLEASLTIEQSRVVAQGSLDIQRAKQDEGGIKLPLFNFFRNGGKKVEQDDPQKFDVDAKPVPDEEALPPDGEELPPPRPVPDSASCGVPGSLVPPKESPTAAVAV